MRYRTKHELLEAIDREHGRFLALAEAIPENRYRERGVWGDGWNVQDLFAHLTEWEQMFLTWYRDGVAGRDPVLPAPGFRWSQTPALNEAIWRKHHARPLEAVLDEFARSFEEIRALARSLSEEQLLTPGHFAWTGRLPLVSYLGPNTSSHYRTAARYLKRWLRARGE